MAKKQKISQASASFHYLVKRDKDDEKGDDLSFSDAEFQKIARRIKDTSPIDLSNDAEVRRIKVGQNLQFLHHTELSPSRHFGVFEGAYYGQEFRNAKHGVIGADVLNLRQFCYLLDHRRDGKIVVGSQYTGNYGDYDGLRKCFSYILRSNQSYIVSRSITSLRHELGDGTPIELKLQIKRKNPKAGGAKLFSRSGLFTIKRSDFGETFEEEVRSTLGPISRVGAAARKSALAKLISQGDIMEIDDDDIMGCSVVVKKDGNQHTVYLLGDNEIATRIPINVSIRSNGLPTVSQVQSEMVRLLNEFVTPALRK